MELIGGKMTDGPSSPMNMCYSDDYVNGSNINETLVTIEWKDWDPRATVPAGTGCWAACFRYFVYILLEILLSLVRSSARRRSSSLA